MASFMDASSDLSLESAVEHSDAVSLAENKNTDQDQLTYSDLVEFVLKEFGRSKEKRMTDEYRWLECYRNYRGLYGPTTQFTSTEKSKAFIKITKTKVQAAVAQITEVLFAGNKFPIGIETSRLPVGADETVSFDPQAAAQPSLRANPQMDPQIAKVLGPKKNVLAAVEGQLQPGSGTSAGAIIYEPAKDAARKMEKQIHDQLDETDASKHLRNAVNELALFGSMVMKGPLALKKEYPKWNTEGKYTPEFNLVPRTEYVSVWDAYPDADARSTSEMEKFIQRHRLSKSDLRSLNKRPHFRKANIEAAISEGPNYEQEYWEFDLTEQNDVGPEERWQVLEYWGICDKQVAEEAGLKIPKQFKDHDQIQINAWICGAHVLRLVFNPFTPERIPYYITPYELNPYSIFGIGVAENMLDTQLLMNGFMRLAVDNAALSSIIIFEVNDFLVPGQSMELFPGKVFRRSGGTQGQAVNSTKFDNHSQEILMLFDKARQLSDESTGMPSYAHGMTGVQSVNRTASGMSMLMGAAAQNIKAVVRNIDDYLLTPLGKAYFAFNMQFNFDADYIADLAVIAKGTESLMRNEIRSQRLLQLGQFAASNPAIAPLVKWDYILREYVASLDLDEDRVVNDPRLAAIQAAQMQTNAMLSQPPQEMPQDPNAQGPQGGVPNPSDPGGTGNGNIAPGNAPEPGAQGFTG
jgi:hypothetical protein